MSRRTVRQTRYLPSRARPLPTSIPCREHEPLFFALPRRAPPRSPARTAIPLAVSSLKLAKTPGAPRAAARHLASGAHHPCRPARHGKGPPPQGPLLGPILRHVLQQRHALGATLTTALPRGTDRAQGALPLRLSESPRSSPILPSPSPRRFTTLTPRGAPVRSSKDHRQEGLRR
jgi:hypothetical protein